MTKEELDALEAVVNAASVCPPPWEFDDTPDGGSIDHGGCGVAYLQPHGNVRTVMRHGESQNNADGRAIVALRNAAPELLAGMRELKEERRRLGEAWRALFPHNRREIDDVAWPLAELLRAIELETREGGT